MCIDLIGVLAGVFLVLGTANVALTVGGYRAKEVPSPWSQVIQSICIVALCGRVLGWW